MGRLLITNKGVMMNKFTEYRASDYRIARSMKEAYGWDAPLYVEESENPIWSKICLAAVVSIPILFMVMK